LTFNPTGKDYDTVMIWVHGGFVTVAFMLMAAAAVIARYLKKKRWRIAVHRAMGGAGAACAFVGVASAFVMVSRYGGPHLSVTHTWWGAVTFFGAVLTPTLGEMQFRFPRRAATFRKIHRPSGWITVILMAVTIVTGAAHAGIF
jgi:hypothetical protein